jgi:exodeoxyribonuclease VII large subunit
VQGPGAAEAIAAALRALDASGVDVIALVRGGGSLEDLWAFNERAVAEAIFQTRAPVVTGIGHETDTTLADLVADRRAHTPTDAAQTLIPARAELEAKIARLGNYLTAAFARLHEERLQRFARLAARPVLRDPGWILDQRAEALGGLHRRLDGALAGALERRRTALARLSTRFVRHTPESELARRAQSLATLRLRLCTAAERALERRSQRLQLAARGLESVSPLAVLARGYSLVRRAAGGPALTSVEGLAEGTRVHARLARGSFTARVETVEPEEQSPA